MKSNHKHIYKDCLISEIAKYRNKFYSFWYLGGKCEICGKLQKRRWYIQLEDIPEDVKRLPIVIHDTTGVTKNL